MKKSTLIITALLFSLPATLLADEGLQEEGASAEPAPKREAPILLAQAVAGEEFHAQGNPIARLPGMAGSTAASALPQRVISDLTNVPNPFDTRKTGLEGQTQISYQLISHAPVSIEVYDLLGMKVRGWSFAAGANGGRQGANTIVWDGTNEAGRKVAKGGYLAEVVIETPQGTVTAVRKIGVIR